MTYAIAPESADRAYLTPGKAYEVRNDDGVSFDITDDVGDGHFCLWNGCAYLDGGDWIKSEHLPIDWTKPLELMDGTPVRLLPADHYAIRPWGGTQPDRGGHHWIEREDGCAFEGGCQFICGDETGFSFGIKVRNRAEVATEASAPTPAEGLTELRDRFAMAALAAAYRNDVPRDCARWVYAVADAMLAERAKS